ncbi:hypothetical protein AwDysgo_02620 [Bacteroidales bacterium]|nr:hypothetical protein AwDysgo_02620 [Bacteroidales bacterium]
MKAIMQIDFNSMPISEYNKQYIDSLLPNLQYYFQIYSAAIKDLLPAKEGGVLIVDYGGGHGFFSLFLKCLGFDVVYCDYNPLSVHTAMLIKQELGFGPDHIVEGDSAALLAYCSANKLKVQYLAATDLIEHVYDLNIFFSDLSKLNPHLEMIFTTGSNPCNSTKSARLRKMMLEMEREYFLPMRQEYISKKNTNLNSDDILTIAKFTRGLTYEDIDKYIAIYAEDSRLPVATKDPYNTCDPASGNWMERILPLEAYRQILGQYGFEVQFKKGFYNEQRSNIFLSILVKALNIGIGILPFYGLNFAPYLVLLIKPLRR